MSDHQPSYFETPNPPMMDVPRYYGPADVMGVAYQSPLDPQKVHATIDRMQQQINVMINNVETLQYEQQRLKQVTGDAVKDLYDFAEFVSKNPGMGLTEWLNVARVTDVINRAMRTTYPDDAPGIAVGTSGNMQHIDLAKLGGVPPYSINGVRR